MKKIFWNLTQIIFFSFLLSDSSLALAQNSTEQVREIQLLEEKYKTFLFENDSVLMNGKHYLLISEKSWFFLLASVLFLLLLLLSCLGIYLKKEKKKKKEEALKQSVKKEAMTINKKSRKKEYKDLLKEELEELHQSITSIDNKVATNILHNLVFANTDEEITIGVSSLPQQDLDEARRFDNREKILQSCHGQKNVTNLILLLTARHFISNQLATVEIESDEIQATLTLTQGNNKSIPKKSLN